jgi:hypothetical protein
MAWESASVVLKLKDTTLPRQYLQAVGRELVQIILRRTAAGKDKNGKPFVGYSDDYKESDDFGLTGKSPGNVNLRLSGDMLADFSVLAARNGRIILGFDSEEQRAKAHGHMTGQEGSGNLPVRDFLGISDEELAQAIRKVPPPKKLKEAFKTAQEKLLEDDDGFDFFGLNDIVELADLVAMEAEIL